MDSNISTVAYQSNLQPVADSFLFDSKFHEKVHDPFALKILKSNVQLTRLQDNEYSHSIHCSFADPKDYPWGTIINAQKKKQVVCRCINTTCRYFSGCRPDFDPEELKVRQENEQAKSKIVHFEKLVQKLPLSEEGDTTAAANLFAGKKTEINSEQRPEGSGSSAGEADENDPFVVRKPSPAPPKPEAPKNIDFGSFRETTQLEIIEKEPVARTIVNAGPGTGKTWTLIEKIIYMINEGQSAAENILVLCFSRAAVEVVRSRLSEAAETGRIGYEWQDVDVRTFDSFSTYMLAWMQDNHAELLPKHFLLETHNYEERIKVATSVFKKKKDILADYEHIIVDEVQDLVGNRAEMVLAMLKGLPDTCGFTMLGDSCQALYDYMAEGDPSVMSSQQFYQNIFKSFPDACYLALTENHRQGDAFGEMTIPYRKAILTGSAQDRISTANSLLVNIPQLPVKLTKFSKADALQYVINGSTLGILTRTNGQALQISAWLRNADVSHALHRGLGSPTLGDWIAQIFCNYDNESIDETTFVAKHLAAYPKMGYDAAQARWSALVSTQTGEAKQRYEVSDLLKGLLRNAKEPMLYESGAGQQYAITVSNIHRAKGREFDSVIVIDDVIEGMADPEKEDLLEHKVCYVALTRPKKRIERAAISKKDKQIYITRNEDQTKRCSKAGGFGKRYISHFEVGSDTDLDTRSLAADKKLQQYIRNNVYPGMRLKLIKCPEGTKPYVVYRAVMEDNEKIVLGYTSSSFARELEKAIQHIKNLNCSVWYDVYPHAFCDVYVHNVTTCVSGMPPTPDGAKTFGDISVWSGVTITGFAAVDKDTY